MLYGLRLNTDSLCVCKYFHQLFTFLCSLNHSSFLFFQFEVSHRLESAWAPTFGQKLTQSYTKPKNNNIYEIFHGITKQDEELIKKNGFRPSVDGMLGEGQQYALKLMANVKIVVKIDMQRHPMQKKSHYCGYDTAWMPPNCGMVIQGPDIIYPSVFI
uniref:Uncharacterized protein n=1 Tax=Erpetoichthys calabaricus TaxID=27687 RepID=A0A8C4X344_ERPCA